MYHVITFNDLNTDEGNNNYLMCGRGIGLQEFIAAFVYLEFRMHRARAICTVAPPLLLLVRGAAAKSLSLKSLQR